jgi:uncharacterized protein YjdB
MKKQLLLTLSAMVLCLASYASITGPSSACSGTTVTYHDSTLSGGTWSSSNPAVASINASTGVTAALSVGTATISYVTALVTETFTMTVNPSPAAITSSATTVCAGSSITVGNTTPGGAWSSLYTWVATTDGSNVYGVNPGVTQIRYTTPGGCYSSLSVTVNGIAAGSIVVPSTVCLGSTVTAMDSVIGGTWSSADPAIATVVSTGTYSAAITGVSLGTVAISYTVPSSCGSSTTVEMITVISTSDAGTISGPSSVVAGSSIYLSETVSGGTWSIAPSSVATINAAGMVTGLAAGSAVVTYTTTGCGGTASTTYPVTVTAFDGIAGDISFGSAYYYGQVKVWLITLTGTTLAAVDSTIVYCSGPTVHYSFGPEPTSNYRVKAAIPDSAGFTPWTGFVPTYHTSSFYWNTADVLSHTSGTGDLGVNINMMTGTVTSGPGFIGGDVTTGANKGTSTGMPVQNLMMYCVDNATGALYAAVRTNAAGHYSFNNLPTGVYKIFPDSLNYATTTYDNINITSTSTSYNAASFIQHTLSKTITPIPVGVGNVATAEATVVAAPNPTTGKVSIKWQLPADQHATVVVTDVTGRVVMSSALNMTVGAGSSDLNLGNLVNGLYAISVKSLDLSYTTKIQVQH